MEPTIEQVLQRGVAAHKKGKLQDAERFYRAILKSQPAHSDANHNLGVLAVSVNKVEVALPLFKTALEANPNEEQFWLSYIDALIREQQFENAKQLIKKARMQGVARKKLNHFEAQLWRKNKKLKSKSTSPPQELIDSLVGHYQNGRFSDAEKLSTELTQEFPEHQFAWKVLGAVLGANGKKFEAIEAHQTAVKLAPQDSAAHNNLGVALQEIGRLDEAEASCNHAIALKSDFAEAHYNLGNTLQELGRLNEAKTSYEQAIALKPDYVLAHSNLGNTLGKLGRLDKAEVSYKQAIALKPDYTKAYNNLGNTLQQLGKLDEAETSYKKAIALKPDFAEAQNNLGNTLQELGRLDEAEVSYKQAIVLKPDSALAYYNLGNALKELGRLDEAEANYTQAVTLKPDHAESLHNLSIVQSYMNNLEAEIVSLQHILQIDKDDYGLRAGVNLAICHFLKGDFQDSKKHLLASSKIQERTSSEFTIEKIYWKYLLDILSWHEKSCVNPPHRKANKTLFVIGESHSLASHYLHVQSSGSVMLCQAKLIKGCMQWHLGNSKKNQFKNQFNDIFSSLPKHSKVLLTVGEIDCRLDSGIIKHKNKFPEKEIEEIIADTIENYLIYIKKNNFDYQHTIIIQGVPCPNIDAGAYSEKEILQLIETIRKFNVELKTKARKKGFGFLDVHELTDRGDGFSNTQWHIDKFHLSPNGFLEAWRRYV